MTHTEEIAELKAHIAEQQARLAALEAKIADIAPKEATRPAAKPIEEGTRVSALMPSATAFVRPSEAELHQLMDVVLAKFRIEIPTFESFCAAFKGLAYLYRTEEPDRRVYLYHWSHVVQRLARSLGGHTEIPGPALICAALSHGDIPWTDGRVDGSVFELGLNEYIGKQATDAWRRVLNDGPLAPTPVPRSRQIPPPSRVRVTTE